MLSSPPAPSFLFSPELRHSLPGFKNTPWGQQQPPDKTFPFLLMAFCLRPHDLSGRLGSMSGGNWLSLKRLEGRRTEENFYSQNDRGDV